MIIFPMANGCVFCKVIVVRYVVRRPRDQNVEVSLWLRVYSMRIPGSVPIVHRNLSPGIVSCTGKQENH